MHAKPVDDCGPATPGSPCESPGLGYSEFARHYYRNHGCFLFLEVLRWFTSLRLPDDPMDSDRRKECSHSLGFPIRKSPDHSLLAASRGLSQLIASFFAFLRLGIHTHALSSLTIKSTTHIRPVASPLPYGRGSVSSRHERYSKSLSLTCVLYARQIFSCQRSRLRQQSAEPKVQRIADG